MLFIRHSSYPVLMSLLGFIAFCFLLKPTYLHAGAQKDLIEKYRLDVSDPAQKVAAYIKLFAAMSRRYAQDLPIHEGPIVPHDDRFHGKEQPRELTAARHLTFEYLVRAGQQPGSDDYQAIMALRPHALCALMRLFDDPFTTLGLLFWDEGFVMDASGFRDFHGLDQRRYQEGAKFILKLLTDRVRNLSAMTSDDEAAEMLYTIAKMMNSPAIPGGPSAFMAGERHTRLSAVIQQMSVATKGGIDAYTFARIWHNQVQGAIDAPTYDDAVLRQLRFHQNLSPKSFLKVLSSHLSKVELDELLTFTPRRETYAAGTPLEDHMKRLRNDVAKWPENEALFINKAPRRIIQAFRTHTQDERGHEFIDAAFAELAMLAANGSIDVYSETRWRVIEYVASIERRHLLALLHAWSRGTEDVKDRVAAERRKTILSILNELTRDHPMEPEALKDFMDVFDGSEYGELIKRRSLSLTPAKVMDLDKSDVSEARSLPQQQPRGLVGVAMRCWRSLIGY